jgi:hypothetical protein
VTRTTHSDVHALAGVGVLPGSREVKPSLPERGADGILLDHELEFEMLLDG